MGVKKLFHFNVYILISSPYSTLSWELPYSCLLAVFLLGSGPFSCWFLLIPYLFWIRMPRRLCTLHYLLISGLTSWFYCGLLMTRINWCICVLRYGGYNYIFSFSDKQLSQHRFLDSPSFSSGLQCPICKIWHFCVCVELFLDFLFCSLGLFAYSCASTHFTNYYNFTVKVWISGRASHYLVTFIQNCLGYSWLLALIPIHSLGLLKIIPLTL